jgi:uncharacterized membrane protein (DUF106 family)
MSNFGGMKILFLVTILGLIVASIWSSVPAVAKSVHAVLDPTLGSLMNWNLNIGFIIIVGILTLITVILQKYMTDQEVLKQIKDEQKIIQQEMKLYKSSPDKQMALSRKSMELQMKAMPITMKPVMYTTIPFILSFRWFADYFATMGSVKLVHFFSASTGWIWAYIIISIIMSIIFRKILRVH